MGRLRLPPLLFLTQVVSFLDLALELFGKVFLLQLFLQQFVLIREIFGYCTPHDGQLVLVFVLVFVYRH